MKSTPSQSQRSSGQLLALLTAAFYALFTLLPNSHSLMVAWPWVLIWQAALLCPVFWLLAATFQEKSFPQLGNKIDWWVGFVVAGLIVTPIFAELPNQAIWYSWASLCFIAALYAINYWLNASQRHYRLLQLQGYLSVAFIIISLMVWGTQTLLPELDRLEQLREFDVAVNYDFSVLELRNWAPLGHQNYVAGYLVLALPLLMALGIVESGWRRWLWLSGVGLGLVDLYTTSSRGGWLGLFVVVAAGLALVLIRSSLPKIWLWISAGGTVLVFLLFILANNRLRSLLLAFLSGEWGGQFAYRLITMTTGWEMGKTHPFTGVGLGNVPWLYQEYRPQWAGYEAELIYQLHSSPAQLWAELGLWGVIIQLGGIVLFCYLLWRWWASDLEKTDLILTGSCFCAFVGYAAMSLTDYQLDNVAISGTLAVYFAVIASVLRKHPFMPFQYSRQFSFAGVGVVVAIVIWLIPIHRSWEVSMQGFNALAQEDVNREQFVQQLTQAHELAPWKPYYAYQLGWNLGDIALTSGNLAQRQAVLSNSINWFQQGLEASRDREFGYTNLGWLQLNQGNPKAATQSFAQSAQLLPAKRGVFYGLGLSLLAQNQTQLAIEAFTLEVLRDPIFITSPLWNIPRLQPIYPQVLESAIARCTEFLDNQSLSPSLNAYFHKIRGIWFWWEGKLEAAQKDLAKYGTPLSQTLLNLSFEKEEAATRSNLPSAPKFVLNAWSKPDQRSQLLQQAWIQARNEPIPEPRLNALLTTMEQSETFEGWLKENPPTWQYRRQRAGFGVNMRQMGGATPSDYFRVVENIPLVVWFDSLFPTSAYSPQLDSALQSQRQSLLEKL